MNLFLIIRIVQAHEEGATSFTVENSLGPILAFLIIFLALITARYIKKNKLKSYEQKTD